MAIYTSQTSVGTTPTLIGPMHTGLADFVLGGSVAFYNPGPTAVVIGNASVTTSTGFTLPSLGTFQADLGNGEFVYGVVATGTQTVQTFESGM